MTFALLPHAANGSLAYSRRSSEPKPAVGLIVDSVGGIVRISPDQISALPAAGKRELGEEIAAVDDRLIRLLDPERVALAAGLTPPPRRAGRRSASR